MLLYAYAHAPLWVRNPLLASWKALLIKRGALGLGSLPCWV